MAKKAKKEEKLYHVEVLGDARTYTTREPCQDGWDRGDTNTEHYIGGIRCVAEGEFRNLSVDFPVKKNETYYLVSVHYGTGDSFGRSEGQLEHVELFKTREAAEALAKLINENERDYRNKPKSQVTYKTESGKEMICYCGTWQGYFESFGFADVNSVNID